MICMTLNNTIASLVMVIGCLFAAVKFYIMERKNDAR